MQSGLPLFTINNKRMCARLNIDRRDYIPDRYVTNVRYNYSLQRASHRAFQ